MKKLNERSAAEDLHFVDVAPLPENPDTSGYIELKKLPAYINWRKQQNTKRN